MIQIPEEIKNLIETDGTRKNIRIVFEDGWLLDLTNKNIVQNSVVFTESLCSQDKLKFGLCEASTFSCTVSGVYQISGQRIIVYNEIICDSSVQDSVYKQDLGEYVYPICMGHFTVSSCKRVSDLPELRSIVAYGDSITANDKSLPDFQNWKVNTPAASNATSIEYGFNKLKEELQNIPFIGSQYLLEYLEPVESFDLLDPTPEEEGRQGRVDYNVAIEFINAIEHVSKYQSGSMNYPSIFDFNNKDRIYRSSYQIATTSFVNVIKNLINNGHYIVSGSMEALDWVYDVAFVAERKINDSIYKQSYKIKKNQNYYCYFPIGNSSSESNCSRAYLRIPQKVIITEITYDTTGSPVYSITNYDLGGSLNSIIYRTITETLPAVKINIDTPITYNNVNYYVASDETKNNINLYSILNGYLEIQGKFGKYNRGGEWEFVSLASLDALFPKNTIVPTNDTYPIDPEKYLPVSKDTYKSVEYETYKTHKYGYVRVTYLATDNEKYSITVECDSRYDNVYDMTDNYVLLSRVYTAAEVKELITTVFYPRIKDIEFKPANVKIKGSPHLEAGDIIRAVVDGEALENSVIETYALRRTMSGEQYLVDTIESKGEKRNESSDSWIALAGQIEGS